MSKIYGKDRLYLAIRNRFRPLHSGACHFAGRSNRMGAWDKDDLRVQQRSTEFQILISVRLFKH